MEEKTRIEFIEVFAKRLQQLMDSRGMSRRDLSIATNIPIPTLHRYLHGARKSQQLEYVITLADYFGVSVDWILGLSEEKDEKVLPEVREFVSLYYRASPDDKKVINALLDRYREK